MAPIKKERMAHVCTGTVGSTAVADRVNFEGRAALKVNAMRLRGLRNDEGGTPRVFTEGGQEELEDATRIHVSGNIHSGDGQKGLCHRPLGLLLCRTDCD